MLESCGGVGRALVVVGFSVVVVVVVVGSGFLVVVVVVVGVEGSGREPVGRAPGLGLGRRLFKSGRL